MRGSSGGLGRGRCGSWSWWRGSANKEIAAALGCSTKGVEAHLTVLYRKADTDSRTGLIARVWESL